jgi:fatty aldehyde-generating acyl-ACP reductase
MSSSPRDFALIGHLDSFARYRWFFDKLRAKERAPIEPDDLRNYLDGMPASRAGEIPEFVDRRGNLQRGCYIDCYFEPERLGEPGYQRRAIRKVRAGCELAAKLPVKVAALGGFTSILGELSSEPLSRIGDTYFTTGNTLTCWAVLQGALDVAKRVGITPKDARVLVIGASGDIGTGCVRWLNGRVRHLDLVARTLPRLQKLAAGLTPTRTSVSFGDDVSSAAPEADIVISVASTLKGSFDVAQFRSHAVIADAGYPKNVVVRAEAGGPAIFHAGMMQLPVRVETDPDWLRTEVYPRENAIHGCLAEGFVLAMSRRYEPYSSGRGNITPERIDEIGGLALDLGFGLAEHFNAAGPLFATPPKASSADLAVSECFA